MADSNEIDKAKKDAKNVIDNYENGLKKLNAAAQRNAEIAKEIKRLEEELKKNNRTIGRNRKFLLYASQVRLYNGLVRKFDLKSELDECKTEEDMFKLIDSIISRIVMEPLPKTDESSTEESSDEFSEEK